ncbi:talin rod domain-containing protein 1-like [Dreissena polymorpha]|nr:talin rod domain-containing protein 1-like [Dreissena polymorpha]
MKSGMSSQYSHAVARHCEHTQNKIHTVAELLLLSGQFRPIKTENISSVEVSIASAREQINSSLNIILEIVNDLTKIMHDIKTRWKVICDYLYRMSDAVTVLVELSYFAVYQYLGLNKPESLEAPLIDKYATSYAGLEIKLSCIQLKRARMEELSSSFIMDICSNISKYISVLTDNCRGASENGPDTATKDQFKLGIKSVTCAAGSLIASIKCYKSERSPRYHTRVVTFCEPVLAASNALVSLATEDEFIDHGRELSPEEAEIQMAIFGPCMNIVSGCVQICKSLRDYTYDPGNSHYVHKTRSCQACIVKSTKHLKHELQKHLHMDFQMRGASPSKGDNYFRDVDSSDENQHDLSPLGGSLSLQYASENHGMEGNYGKDLSPRSTVTDVSLATSISR